MNVFCDTSAFYAALSQTDCNHESAVHDLERLMQDDATRFYTSNYVVVESCALIRNRLGNDALRDFLENLLPMAAVLWIDQKAHMAATEAMLSHGKNGPSLVDCSSFAIMRENGLQKALAYDKHFSTRKFSL
jgi:predicted nucleic acid-binding protein